MKRFYRTWRECLGEEPWFDLFFLYVLVTDVWYVLAAGGVIPYT